MYRDSPSIPLSRESLTTPDVTFSTAFGVYVAALFSPAVAAALAGIAPLGPAGTYVTFISVALGLVVGGGAAARRVRGLPERLGNSPLAWGLPLLGVTALGGYVAVTFGHGPFSGVLTGFGMMTATIGVLLGFLLRTMAHSRYTAALLADVEDSAEWTAGWPERRQAIAGGLAIGLMIFGIVSFFLDVLPGGVAVDIVGALAYIAGPALINLGQPRTYRVTPRGLERSNPAYRSVIGWDAIEGVARTDRELVIRRRAWYRPAIHCALDQMDDPEAVRSSLAQYVD